MTAGETQGMPYGSRINQRIPSRSHHVGTGNRRRFSEIFCFLRILLSCLSRKCHDGGCMVKTRMARFGLTKIWRILTRKPQSLEEAFQWVCAQYNSKESKKLTSFPPTTFCRNAPVWRSNWGSLFLGADIWEGIPSVISIQSISIIPQAQTLQDTLSYLLIFKEVIWHEAWSIILKRSWQQNTFVN